MAGRLNPLPNKYYLVPRRERTIWLYHRLAEILATYVSKTAYLKTARILNENHRAAKLPAPTPIERQQLILDALELRVVHDTRGRTWRLQGTLSSVRRHKKTTYLIFVRED